MTKEKLHLGIDLGTVNTSYSYCREDGSVTIGKFSDGDTLMPSAIRFTHRGKVVGRKAFADETNTSTLAVNFKRQMGTEISRKVFDSVYSPTEMSAIVIRKTLLEYRKEVGNTTRNAVITVPGDYSTPARIATKDAAVIAGLESPVLLNESTAAALSFGTSLRGQENKLFMVFDLGGGTFDATVVSREGNEFTVLSNEGSNNIGGKDWDLEMAGIIQKKAMDSAGLTLKDVEKDFELRRAILKEARAQKETLSSVERSISTLPVRGRDITFTVWRDEFEVATRPLMDKLTIMANDALKCAGVPRDDLETIVLVGGDSLMTQILRTLDDAFPSAEVEHQDPMHAVSMGAAIYANSLYGSGDIKVTQVLNRSYGVVAGLDGEETICNVLFRNQTLPLQRTISCRPKRDDQERIDLMIYESMSDAGSHEASDAESFMVSECTVPLQGRVSRGKTKIPITFTAEVDGIIKVMMECNGIVSRCLMGSDVKFTAEEISEAKVKVMNVV